MKLISGSPPPPPSGIDDDWANRLEDSHGVHLAELQRGITDAETIMRPWTPAVSFTTPGDLSVAYTFRDGLYIRQGRNYRLWGNLKTSAFTFTTATGSLLITGIPRAVSAYSSFYQPVGSCTWSGITLPAGYTQVNPIGSSGATTLTFQASGSASALLQITTTHAPTTSTLNLRFQIDFRV